MKRRHRRIAFIIVGLAGLAIATFLVASAFKNNLVFFFSPTQVAAKEAPVNRTFRVGGLVRERNFATRQRWTDSSLYCYGYGSERAGCLQRHSSRSF